MGRVSKLAEESPPRNVCEDHPLCLFPSCIHVSGENSMYCTDHVEMKCQALTKKKKPCKGKPISALVPFCDNHRHLIDTLNVEEENESDGAEKEEAFIPNKILPCKSLTKKGNPCRGERMPGSEYCFDHAPVVLLGVPPQAKPISTKPEHQKMRESEIPYVTVSAHEEYDMQEGRETGDNGGEVYNSSSDSFATAGETDFVDASKENLACDEIDVEDEGENLQHLRDVFEVDSGSESGEYMSVSSKGTDEVTDAPEIFDTRNETHSCEPEKWNWDMSLDQRWEASQLLMEELRTLLIGADSCVKSAVVLARKELHEAKTCAKTRVYENKSVIGGTMVGCISRLDAIRKTKPFAVVVEEASEVLEPLLFSCLSESTKKLEMIGDHRQLQPSVMSRFEFELCNQVNISMFQRLIEAPLGHAVSSTVLSIQVSV